MRRSIDDLMIEVLGYLYDCGARGTNRYKLHKAINLQYRTLLKVINMLVDRGLVEKLGLARNIFRITAPGVTYLISTKEKAWG